MKYWARILLISHALGSAEPSGDLLWTSWKSEMANLHFRCLFLRTHAEFAIDPTARGKLQQRSEDQSSHIVCASGMTDGSSNGSLHDEYVKISGTYAPVSLPLLRC